MADPDSERVMAAVDAMTPAMRRLVYEFGAGIVSRMIGEGYDDADQLRDVLETWRERRQTKWLETDFIVRRHE